MKKNKVLLLVLLILLMLCTACGEKKVEQKEGTRVETKDVEKKEEEKKEEEPKEEEKETFLCSNQKITLDTPKTWKRYTGSQMNKDSCLELVGMNNEKILLVISEGKSYFKSYNAWFDVVYGTAKKSYNLDDSQIRRSDEGGLNTRFVEHEMNSEGTDVYLQLYFIETNNYYNQVLIWTEAKNKDAVNAEFRDIALSLKEIG